MDQMGPKTTEETKTRQVLQALRTRIATGDYAAGSWLPTERSLADEFGVHRRAIRDAITMLAEEGQIICRPRYRPLVSDQPRIKSQIRFQTDPPPMPSHAAGSRLVALIMWHGCFEERTTAQQRIFWGFNQTLAQANYHGVFLDLGETIESEAENAVREAMRLHYALEHRFAGIAFYPYAYHSNRDLIRETARQIPIVLIDRQIPGIETDYVGIDNLSAMQNATRTLQEAGHSRIALVTRSEPINTVQDRIMGYRMAMRAASQGAGDQVITVDSPLEWSMFDLIFRLPRHERPTALLCVNDFIALQVAKRLELLGVHIPGDVALIGFDDLVEILPQGVGLSSVAQPFEKIGAAAADVLLKRIVAPDLLTQHIELPTTLTLRASSAVFAPNQNYGSSLVSQNA
jgi:GntR family transcriptional regulator of arabinose operon